MWYLLGDQATLLLGHLDRNLLAFLDGYELTLFLVDLLRHLSGEEARHVPAFLPADIPAHLVVHFLLVVLYHPAALLDRGGLAHFLGERLGNLAALGAWLVPALVLGHQSLNRLGHGDAGIFLDDAALLALNGLAPSVARHTVRTHHLAGHAGAAGLRVRANRGNNRGTVGVHVATYFATGGSARRFDRRAVAVNVISVPTPTTEASGGERGQWRREGRAGGDRVPVAVQQRLVVILADLLGHSTTLFLFNRRTLNLQIQLQKLHKAEFIIWNHMKETSLKYRLNIVGKEDGL